jgi:1-acyl-sn-glycerol-3-phosphate acyltransferase
VLFVANHASHMDTPTLLRALPAAWRRRTLVAAAADYFYGNPRLAATVALAFGTVPVERRGGATEAASNLDELLWEGWSVVVFAEGTRSRDGTVGRLRSGAAVLAAAHGIPIVPVHVGGTHAVMPPGRGWMRRPSRWRRAPISVSFGPPIRLADGEHRTDVMERVRLFLAACGAVTTPDKRIAARRRRAAAGRTPV